MGGKEKEGVGGGEKEGVGGGEKHFAIIFACKVVLLAAILVWYPRDRIVD